MLSEALRSALEKDAAPWLRALWAVFYLAGIPLAAAVLVIAQAKGACEKESTCV